jgi:hypothetical protein
MFKEIESLTILILSLYMTYMYEIIMVYPINIHKIKIIHFKKKINHHNQMYALLYITFPSYLVTSFSRILVSHEPFDKDKIVLS